MRKIWLWIIWILIVIYIWYWVVLTSFSVNVTAKEQCYNETFECYRKCWAEDNKKNCLLFKQWYWKWIFLWWYSFVETKIKDISNKEEFNEYWSYNSLNEETIPQNVENEINITKESYIFSWEVIDVINKNSVPVEIISLWKKDNQYIYVLKVYFKDIFQSVNFKFTTNSEIQNGDFELKDSGRRLLLKNWWLSIGVRNNEISVENPSSTYIQCYERTKDSWISFPMFSWDIVKEWYEKDWEYFPTVTYSTLNNASAFYKVNPYPFVMEPIKTWENNCVVELNRKETLSEDAISPFVFGEWFEKALYLIPKDKTIESDCKWASRFIWSLPEAKSLIVEASKLACHIYHQNSLNHNFPEIKEISIELHWIQHNPEEWTITLDNWEESVTIMDKNLWATIAWTWEESFWYYFQRWNNYGFSPSEWIKTWTVKVKAEEALKYWPNNPYKNDVMYVWLSWYDQMVNYHNYDYMEINNDNLWWWSWDDKLRPEEVEKYWAPRDYFGEYSLEDYVWDTWNPREERQWPCPEWFHVPSYLEWKNLISIRKSIENPKELESDWVYLWRKLRDDLLLPWAWWLRFNSNVTPHDRWSVWYYRSSSPSWFTQTSTNSAITSSRSYRSAVFSVRCFKN